MNLRKSVGIIILCLGIIRSNCVLKNLSDADSKARNWLAINSELTDLHIQAIAIDPDQPATLYVSCHDGIFKSSNGGKSWKLSNNGMTSNDVQTLVCNPQNCNQIYAGTWGDGIFFSNDGAGGWQAMNQNISDLRIRSIIVDPEQSQNIFVAANSQLLKSMNGGASWGSLPKPPGKLFSLALNFKTAEWFVGTDYNGIYKSGNDGTSWTASNDEIPQAAEGYYYNIIALKYFPEGTDSLWAAISNMGIYFYDNQNKNWQQRNSGLTSFSIKCMAVNGKNQRLLVVGTSKGVFITEDGAQNWFQINDGLTNLDVRAIAIDPQDPRIIYAGTMGGGVFKYVRE